MRIKKVITPEFKTFYLPYKNYRKVLTFRIIAISGYIIGIRVSLFHHDRLEETNRFIIPINFLIDHTKEEVLVKKSRRVDTSLRMYKKRYQILPLLHQIGFEILKRKLIKSTGEEIDLKNFGVTMKDTSSIGEMDTFVKMHTFK